MPRARADQCSALDTEHITDNLKGFFANTEFAQNILKQLELEGYAVLPGIFSTEEADAEYSRAWDFVETVSPGVKRHNERSWMKPDSGLDPWPCSQRDMMQLHQAGWVFSDLRERFAERVFEKMYGTRELHSSKDGFTFQRPTSADLKRHPNDHFDQGSNCGLQCVQGSVALTDQEEGDGCFLCWPRSHQLHGEIIERRGGKQSDFLILSGDEKKLLRSRDIRPVRVPVRRGDVILWRSDLCHCGAPPVGACDRFRAVVYVCCLPASLTPEAVYEAKRRAYLQLETGGHWPCREEWFIVRDKHARLSIQPYLKDPPNLPRRQLELYGLVRYSTLPEVLVPPDNAKTEDAEEEDFTNKGAKSAKRRWARKDSSTA